MIIDWTSGAVAQNPGHVPTMVWTWCAVAGAATTVVTMPAHGHEFFTVPNTQPHFELPAEGMPHFEVLNSQPHFELEADES